MNLPAAVAAPDSVRPRSQIDVSTPDTDRLRDLLDQARAALPATDAVEDAAEQYASFSVLSEVLTSLTAHLIGTFDTVDAEHVWKHPANALSTVQILEHHHRQVNLLRAMTAQRQVQIFGLDDHERRHQLTGLPPGETAFRDAHAYHSWLAGITKAESTHLSRRARYFTPISDPISPEPVNPQAPLAAPAVQRGELDDSRMNKLAVTLDKASRLINTADVDDDEKDLLRTTAEHELVGKARDISPAEFIEVADRRIKKLEHEVMPPQKPLTPQQRDAVEGLTYLGPLGRSHHRYLHTVDQLGHEQYQTLISEARNPRSSANRRENNAAPSDVSERLFEPEPEDTIDVHDPVGNEQATFDQRSDAQKAGDAVLAAIALEKIDESGRTFRRLPRFIVTISAEKLSEILNTDNTPDHPPSAHPPGRRQVHDLLKVFTEQDGYEEDVCRGQFTGDMDPGLLRRVGASAGVIPVVLNSRSEPLDVGRHQRIVPPHIGAAVIARDRGCIAPGCNFPAEWCDFDHVTEWQHGGETSVENCTLLCAAHHQAKSQGRFTVTLDEGIAWCTLPEHIDPMQKPRRNYLFRG